MREKSFLIDEIRDMLTDCDLFNDLSTADLKSAARYFGTSMVEKGNVIFNEGERGTFMCIINFGDVSVLKSDSDEKNVEIVTLHKGRVFGEMAALDGEKRSAMCVAATDCILLTLSKDSIDKMLLEAPKTAAKVIRVVAISLSKRLRMADGRLVDHQI